MQTETRPPSTTPTGGTSKPLTITSKRKIEDPIEQPSPAPVISTNIPNGNNSVASPNGMRDHSTISPLKKMFPLRKRFKSDLPNEENPYATHSLGPASPPPTIPAFEPMRDIEPKSPILPRPTMTTTTATTPNLPTKPPTSASTPIVERSTPKTPTAQRPITSSPSPKRLDKSPPPPQKSVKNENPESQLPPRKAKLAGYNAEESEKSREPTSPKVEGVSGLDPKKRALDKKLESLAKPAQKRKVSIEHEKPKKKLLSRSRIIDSDDEQSDDEATTSASDSDSSDESDGSDVEETGKLYCLCKKPYDKNEFMIACDSCDDWFHIRCVGLSQAAAKRLKQYICPSCRPEDSINPRLQQKRETKVVKPEAKPAKKVVKKAEKKETAKKEERKEKRKTAKNKTTRAAEVSPPGSPKFAKCLNKHCNSSAKQNSKYCSHKCGVSVALENLKKKEEKRSDDNEYSLEDLRKELRLKIHGLRQSREESNGDVMLQGAGVLGTTSVAEIEDLNALEDIDRKKKEIEKGLLSLAKKAEELETAIEIAASLSTANIKLDKAGVKPESRDTMDCHSCGKPIAAATFARHLEQCSLVKERSKSAGDRNRLCGCPTNDVECGYCVVPKESCGKHIGWEGLRKAELVQEKNQLTETVEALNGEEQIIKLRISRRRQASSSEQHRTIVERTPPNHLFSIVPQITPPKPSLPTPTSSPSSSLAAPVVASSPSPSSPASVTTSTPTQPSSSAISSSPSPSSTSTSSTPTTSTSTTTPPTPHSSLDTAVPPSPAETPKSAETALASSTPPTAVATS